MVIRENKDGSVVRMKDVARIELGTQTYNGNRAAERCARGNYQCLSVAGLQRRGSRGRRP